MKNIYFLLIYWLFYRKIHLVKRSIYILYMKFAVFLLLLTLIISGGAHANDVSCQSGLMKPNINPVLIMAEEDKPADLTVAEARLRLKENRTVAANEEEQEKQEPVQANNEKANTKKQSRLGGIFDILLPSKLRNPVR